MARRTLIAAAAWLAAVPAVAGSVAHFSLDLSGEFLGERQEVADDATDRSSLLAAATLTANGHVLDPRFLTFEAVVRRYTTDVSEGDTDDTALDSFLYDGRVRAFANRPLSLELHAGHSRHDVDGFAGAAAVAGASTRRGIGLQFSPDAPFDLRLSHETSDFDADDPATLRDESRSVSRLAARAGLGRVDARLDARREDASLFSGLIDQSSDIALLDVAVDRGGRSSFQSLTTWNDTTVGGDRGAPSTSVLVTQNWFQRRTDSDGFWRVGASSQTSDTDPGTQRAAQVYGMIVEPLAPSLQLDAQLSFLRTDDDALGTRDEPSLSAGLRWGREAGPWDVTVYPRASYATRRGDMVSDETRWGGALFLAARRTGRRTDVGLEAERVDNQRSISGDTDNPTLPSQSFLAGLEKARTRGRLFVEHRFLRRSRARLDTVVEQRVRELRGLELHDDSSRAELTLTLGPFQLRGAASRVEVTGDELPARVEVAQAGAVWAPATWLSVDGLLYSESRRAAGLEGELSYREAGVRLAYAQLAFFARARVEESTGMDALTRTNRRVWIGVSRRFGWTLGRNGGPTRRPPLAPGQGPEAWW